MEIVILSSDIARLVLDYLKSQKLKKATRIFCKTSPYLKQEFTAYKQGLQAHSFFPELEEIICEYVKISRKVEQLLPKMTDAVRSQLQQRKLSEKVSELLERSSHDGFNRNASGNKSDLKNCGSTQSSNTTDETDGKHAKRKRSFGISDNSSNDETGIEINTNKRHKLTSSRFARYSKKRRVLQPYCFLSAKALERRKHSSYTKVSTAMTTDEDIEEEESESSLEYKYDTVGEANEVAATDKEIFEGNKPVTESTPRKKSNKQTELVLSVLPGISQAILENQEFQQKLVNNINQALSKPTAAKTLIRSPQNINETGNSKSEISSKQLLDEMIKNILDATEKDPSFDAIIEEVVEASNKPQVQSAAIQCNIDTTNVPVTASQTLFNSIEPPPLVPAHPATQLQPYPTDISPQTGEAASIRNISNIPATNILPPRTPIILRSATGTISANAAVSSGTGLSTQDPSSLLANNTFAPLIDPNFSISKLIVVNTNDSVQKQFSENCVGNTVADNLMNQMPTSGVVEHNDEQVFFDTSNGQLTFPFILTNDGLLTNLPFLINNDIVNQQLQTNVMANVEGSRLEVPLSEPTVVNANQLPPNSIILSSAQKENTPNSVTLNTEKQENIHGKPETVEKTTNMSEEKHCSTVPPSSLDNPILQDKITPSCGIVNSKAFKSLSTPRKRTSHVRTLTFSPKHPQYLNNATTPLSTRRDTIFHLQRSLPKPVLEVREKTEEISLSEAKKEKSVESEKKCEEKEYNASEKAVIKTVEILPSISSSANATSQIIAENNDISTKETSNIPHLFESEESSNHTVISKHTPAIKETLKDASQPKTLTAVESSGDKKTKRRHFRKTAARSCRRKTSKEDLSLREKIEKEVEKDKKKLESSDAVPSKDDMMEEWIRLRNCKVELDVRLRELNAQSAQSSQIKKVNTKKKVRRRKPAAIKRKEKELVRKAEELERTKALMNEGQDTTFNKKSDTENVENKSLPENDCDNCTEKMLLENDKNMLQEERKLVAVQKPDNTTKEMQKKGKEKAKQPENDVTNTANNHKPTSQGDQVLEPDKRTSNMAFLLETPFKDTNLASGNPPTPGIFAPSLETPAGKRKDPHEEMQASASFLFGSITKSELDTPLMSAITPGFRFTPFGLKEIGTPKSLPGTDYSSGGGSYYKPDENEDLDRNIEKMLRSSAQKKADSETANNIGCIQKRKEGDTAVDKRLEKEHCKESETDEIEIEIPVEKLKVEPIVLKRVKSFSNESVDRVETVNIDPHYTLASGLPEISAAEDECSSSSSSSSSSGSASSSSSSSSSTSSPSSASNASIKSKKSVEKAQNSTTKGSINDLENLSEISSTEDEEWQKLAATDNDDNSQLINNDGEVRYPVRSWLTPVKGNVTIESKTVIKTEVTQTTTVAKPATMKVTLPLKSAEKRNRQVKELELKKQRIKEKLKNDATTVTKKEKSATTMVVAPNISAALATSRMLHAMRDKGKKSANYQLPHSVNPTTTGTTLPVPERRSLDVLTALNLSANKPLPKSLENTPTSQDDNNLVNRPNNLNGEITNNISSPITYKTPQRKCLPIEARPVTRTIRKSGKKIVRTPLAFKVIHSPGKITSHSTTTTLAELAATKTINKNKETTSSHFIQHTLRVSPRLLRLSNVQGKKPPESSTTKGRVTKTNAKAKSAIVAKTKTILPRNRRKREPAQGVLEKEIKDLLNDWKEEPLEKKNDEEFEDDTPLNSAAVLKPKINLKARNAMISTKPKTIARKQLAAINKVQEKKTSSEQAQEKKTSSEQGQEKKTPPDQRQEKKTPPEQGQEKKTPPEKGQEKKTPPEQRQEKKRQSEQGQEKKTPSKQMQEKKTENKVQSEQVKEVQKELVEPTPKSNHIPLSTAKADPPTEENDLLDEDDDPLENCEMTTIDESDEKRFIKYTYNGPEGSPPNVPKRHDFSNFQMVVAIDENEKHVWRITEGVSLFSCAPSSPKCVATSATIPKKRKIRTAFAATVITSDNAPAIATNTATTKIAASKDFSTNAPIATSTPVAMQMSTRKTIIQNGKTIDLTKEEGSEREATTTQKAVEANEKPLSRKNSETPKIQIEDIESILSHLHGT